MVTVYEFRIGISELENEIWRSIELDGNQTIADLAYAILVSFNSLAYHLFDFEIGNVKYSCGIEYEDAEYMFYDYIKDPMFSNIEHKVTEMKNATKIKLNDIDFGRNKKFKFKYDFGSTTEFNIELKKVARIKKNIKATKTSKNEYPKVIDGKGYGMIDDMPGFELVDIVKEYCKKDAEPYFIGNIFHEAVAFNYTKFDVESNQFKMKMIFEKIKENYENNMEG